MTEKMSQKQRQDRARRLRQARKAAEIGLKEACEKFGFKEHAYKAHESGRNGFGFEAAKAYAEAYEVYLPWLMYGEGVMKPSLEVVEYDPLKPSYTDRVFTPGEKRLEVVGKTAAGQWFERDELQQAPIELLPVAEDASYGGRRQYALKVEGDSMNRVIGEGEYAICVDLYGHNLREMDLVIAVQRRDGLYERTIKRFRSINGAPYLVPESTNERWKPIPFDAERFEVEALVIGKYGRLL